MPSSTLHNPKILPNAGQLLCAAPPAGRPVCSEPLLQTPCPRVASADFGWGSHPGPCGAAAGLRALLLALWVCWGPALVAAP